MKKDIHIEVSLHETVGYLIDKRYNIIAVQLMKIKYTVDMRLFAQILYAGINPI